MTLPLLRRGKDKELSAKENLGFREEEILLRHCQDSCDQSSVRGLPTHVVAAVISAKSFSFVVRMKELGIKFSIDCACRRKAQTDV